MRLAIVFASLACVASTSLIAGCGGRVDGDGSSDPTTPTSPGSSPSPSSPSQSPSSPPSPSPPGASSFFVPDDRFCARASNNLGTADLKPQNSTEDIAVVELTVAEECTNLGGQYLLARDLHANKKYWLGGHGCRETKALTGAATTYGVLRYMSTSSVLTIPAGVCVAFAGDDTSQPTTTATKVRAIAMFDTQAKAEAYAATVRR